MEYAQSRCVCMGVAAAGCLRCRDVVGLGAPRAQRQAQCNLLQLRHQLDPNEANAQRVRDVISMLEEYRGFALGVPRNVAI